MQQIPFGYYPSHILPRSVDFNVAAILQGAAIHMSSLFNKFELFKLPIQDTGNY